MIINTSEDVLYIVHKNSVISGMRLLQFRSENAQQCTIYIVNSYRDPDLIVCVCVCVLEYDTKRNEHPVV